MYSSAGYALLWHMGGYGSASVGTLGVGGTRWHADAALAIDLWVSTAPAGAKPPHPYVYAQYADATGHAPPMRPEALLFWQSRNRYTSSAIALDVAARYASLQLPVGVLVIDYKNQRTDGDFEPDPGCYPSVAALSSGVRSVLNASTVFSFWPEVQPKAAEFEPLRARGCLTNGALGGRIVDATIGACRSFIWSEMVRPRYYEQGVDAFWLDETDGEGTGGGGDGDHGYDTALGPAFAHSNLWVNQWLRLFSEPVAAAKRAPPLVLTRGAWAGAARFGAVLWSSDIWSSFEQLQSQVRPSNTSRLPPMPVRPTVCSKRVCLFSSAPGGAGCPRLAFRHSLVDHRRWRLRLRRRTTCRLTTHARAHRTLVPVWPLLSYLPHAWLSLARRHAGRARHAWMRTAAAVVWAKRGLVIWCGDARHALALHSVPRASAPALSA